MAAGIPSNDYAREKTGFIRERADRAEPNTAWHQSLFAHDRYGGVVTLLARIDRFNGRHPWSHNDFYGGWVVQSVRSSEARDVLDVGCGTGNLIDRLRAHIDRVTGIEPDSATARVAAARFAGNDSVVIEQVRFDQFRSPRQWDAITLVATLHHLPLVDTLRELDRLLSPGGRLVVIGCFRNAGLIDYATGFVASVANLIMGKIKHPQPSDQLPIEMTAPTAAPRETIAEIRCAAAEYLPGARIRRRLFWRYSLVYDKAASAADQRGTTPVPSDQQKRHR
nr:MULTISPECIES: class I SAM-dependent methyltransferase [Nocardia]